VVLAAIPFLLIMLLYSWGSAVRKAENPDDKLLPTATEMASAIQRMAFEPNRRTGEYQLWQDTASSLQRLSISVGLAALIGCILGVLAGAIPYLGSTINPLVTAVSLIPPLAVLPILFIVFGLGELAKVVLIVVGITPVIVRDLYQRTVELPKEQLVKAQTLGGNSSQIIFRVILPQILPRLIAAVRLSLGAAWLFLIAAEAIASTDGLGYRIFLVRRYLSMDIIIPYVLWIALLAFMIDWLLNRVSKSAFPWYHTSN
jgi:NitT/TauT family transport system permease protein